MSDMEQMLLQGQLTNADGEPINVSGDLEQIYRDEVALVTRPSVMRRIAVTAAGVAATALWYGNQNRELAIKSLYALFAAGIGINAGMIAMDSRVDSVAAAALYYAMTKASSSLNLTGEDMYLGYESLAAMAAGLAYDYYIRSSLAKK